MNYNELRLKIKQGIDPLYVFFGEEVYLRTYMVSFLSEKIVEPDFADFNSLTLDSETLSAATVADFFEAVPVMADKKLLLIKDAGLLSAKCRDAELFAKMFSDIPDYVTVIITEDTADKRGKLYKSLSKAGTVCEFSYLERPELKQRVLKKLAAVKKNISNADLEFFLDRCSSDLTEIRLNTEKLIAYSGSRDVIKKDDIEKNITPPLLNRVYDISEAVMNKNSDYALRLLSDLKKNGESGVRILAILGGYFSDLCRAAAISKENMSYSDAVDAMNLPPARRFVAQKLLSRAKTVDIKYAEKCLSDCVRAENAIKNGTAAEWQALDMLVLEFLAK